MSVVKSWPVSSDVAQVQSVLGFIGFYRGFIANFSWLARPLHALVSHSLSNAEQKLKFLALRWVIMDKFHDYLDNNPLTFVVSLAKLDATEHRRVSQLTGIPTALNTDLVIKLSTLMLLHGLISPSEVRFPRRLSLLLINLFACLLRLK